MIKEVSLCHFIALVLLYLILYWVVIINHIKPNIIMSRYNTFLLKRYMKCVESLGLIITQKLIFWV